MIKRYQKTAISQYVIVLITLFGVLGVSLLSMQFMSRVPYEDHFAHPWAAGRFWLFEGLSPYDQEIVTFAENILEDSSFLGQLPENSRLTHPMVSLYLYLPFSLLDYNISRVLWVTLSALFLVLSIYFAFKLSGLRFHTIENLISGFLFFGWLPGIFGILTGQLSPMIIFILLLGIYLILREQDTAAGFLLALTFGVFFTSGLIMLFLLVWSFSVKRWSLISAYFSGIAALLVISFLLLPAWFLDWFAVILNVFEGGAWLQTPLFYLAETLPGIADFLIVFLHGIFIIYFLYQLITQLGKTGRVFTWKTMAILVLAYILHAQVEIHFLYFVLPAMLMVFRYWFERWGIFGRILSWAFIIALSLGPWLLLYPDIHFTSLPDLPSLEVVFPILVMLGMIWIRWWAVKIPRLSFESR